MTFTTQRSIAAATLLALLSSTSLAHAANLNAGSVTATDTTATTADTAIGDKAPKGTAPNVSPSQAPLSAIEPISVISQKTIQNTVPANSDFASTFATAPSTVVNSPNGMGNGEATALELRGFTDGQFNITFDGIPFGDTNDFTHHTTAYFPSDILSSISVDRGPGYASTVGEATFGGTVAMNSLDTESKIGGTITGGYGSWDTSHIGAVVQSGRINSTGTEIAFSAERNQSHGAITLDQTSDTNETLKITQPVTDRFLLTAFGSLQYSSYNNANQITLAQEAIYGKNYGALSEDPNSQQWVSANNTAKNTDFEYLDFKGDAGIFQLDEKLYTFAYSNHEDDSNNPNQIGDVAYDPTATASANAGNGAIATGYKKLNRYRSIGNIITLSRDIDAGIASGTLKAGAWVEHQNNDRNVYWWNFDTATSYQQELKHAPGKPLSNYKYNINSKIDTQQPYIEYEWKPTTALTVTPGFKYVAFSRTQDGPVNQTTQTPIDQTFHYHAALPYLSANYRFTPNLSGYAEYAKGFLAPNVNLIYVSNPSLNNFGPQKTTNYQVGAVYKSRRLTADADFYYISFNNYITPITIGNFAAFTNDGAVRYKGVEGEATYVVGQGFSIFASGSLNSAKASANVGDAVGVPLAPDWIADFGPVYDNGTYYASFLTKYVGPTPDATGTWWVKTYDTSNLVGGVHLGALMPQLKDVKLSLGIYNILDHRNILDETADVQNGVLQSDTTVDFTAPRSIYGSISTSF